MKRLRKGAYNIKHYLPDSFKKEYINFLNKFEKNPYHDIDCAKPANEDYYNDLTKFLNFRLGNFFKNPKKGENGPFAIYDKKSKLYLTSDTFGFSVLGTEEKFWKSNCNYPYVRYLGVQIKEEVKDIDKCSFVANCIYDTRTIGGAFIWPKVYLTNHKINGKYYNGYYSIYNYFRGSYGYIEDRVDLTLYEIKCFFNVYNNDMEYEDFLEKYTKKYPENIMFTYNNCRNYIFSHKEKEKEKKSMFLWLKRFKSFKDYIDKLCFTPFVKDNGFELRILNLSDKNSTLPVDSENRLQIDQIKSIGNMNNEELHILLTNLIECTKERSMIIEKLINPDTIL